VGVGVGVGVGVWVWVWVGVGVGVWVWVWVWVWGWGWGWGWGWVWVWVVWVWGVGGGCVWGRGAGSGGQGRCQENTTCYPLLARCEHGVGSRRGMPWMACVTPFPDQRPCACLPPPPCVFARIAQASLVPRGAVA
jgi:hypothetical protein